MESIITLNRSVNPRTGTNSFASESGGVSGHFGGQPLKVCTSPPDEWLPSPAMTQSEVDRPELPSRAQAVRGLGRNVNGPTANGFRIIRAAHLGMCFGVRDALTLAHETARQQPVTVLGDLVHNETVLEDLRARGVRFARQPAEAVTNTVMITAHGTSDRMRAQLQHDGMNVVDSTCPLVHFAHRALRELVTAGFYPVIIGKRDHVEVRGMTGDLGEHDVILNEQDVAGLPSRPRFGVISQTTQPIERVRELVQLLRVRFPDSEVRFRDTVCQPTKQRQTAAIELARQCEVVIVIGGAHSNNTRELVTTCSRFCRRVHHVQSAAELQPDWLENATTVGLTAGTSTPDGVIEAVECAIRELCPAPQPA